MRRYFRLLLLAALVLGLPAHAVLAAMVPIYALNAGAGHDDKGARGQAPAGPGVASPVGHQQELCAADAVCSDCHLCHVCASPALTAASWCVTATPPFEPLVLVVPRLASFIPDLFQRPPLAQRRPTTPG